MARLDAKEIRTVLEQRYNMPMEERISRVEFVLPNGERPYFHCSDSFKPSEPVMEKHDYILLVYDGNGEPRPMPFGSRETLDNSFKAFKKLGVYILEAVVDGAVVNRFKPE